MLVSFRRKQQRRKGRPRQHEPTTDRIQEKAERALKDKTKRERYLTLPGMAYPNDRLRAIENSYPKLLKMVTATKESLRVPLNRLKPQEKLPPRFNIKGMSVAVRVLGHEIRHFTHKTTGKDLADLRYSCPDLLKKIGQAAKDSRLPFTTFHIKNFDFPANKNLNEIDFIGNFEFRHVEPVLLPKSSTYNNDFTSSNDEDCCAECESSIYSWKNHRITERELERLQSLFNTTKSLSENLEIEKTNKNKDDWNLYMKMDRFKVWRKKLSNGGPYLFRIHGRYDDITAKSFFQTQNDIEYRSLWDSYAMSMKVVAEDSAGSSEVVRWTTKCPYPMNSREYLFVRNAKIFEEENVAVLVSRATEHPNYPESKDLVRVKTYESQMAIRPYTEFEKNGVEFVLVYCDDPQTYLPSYLIDMITSSGISEMMSRLHKAAKNLNEVKRKRYADDD
eukprot:gene5173-5825_t